MRRRARNFPRWRYPSLRLQGDTEGVALSETNPLDSLVDAIAGMLDSTSQIHQAMAAFERGGPAYARTIERLYALLVEAEEDAFATAGLLDRAEHILESQERRLHVAERLLRAAGVAEEDPTVRTDGRLPPVPNTALAYAFFRTLERWARRETRARAPTLPAHANVDPDELQKVVLAIVAIKRAERQAP